MQIIRWRGVFAYIRYRCVINLWGWLYFCYKEIYKLVHLSLSLSTPSYGNSASIGPVLFYKHKNTIALYLSKCNTASWLFNLAIREGSTQWDINTVPFFFPRTLFKKWEVCDALKNMLLLGFMTLFNSLCHQHRFRHRPWKVQQICSEALISAWGSFTYHKSTTQDPRLYFPSEGSHTQNFYALKKLINHGRVWTREPQIQWRVQPFIPTRWIWKDDCDCQNLAFNDIRGPCGPKAS